MKCKDGEDKNEGLPMECPDKDEHACSDCTGAGCGKVNECADTLLITTNNIADIPQKERQK